MCISKGYNEEIKRYANTFYYYAYLGIYKKEPEMKKSEKKEKFSFSENLTSEEVSMEELFISFMVYNYIYSN